MNPTGASNKEVFLAAAQLKLMDSFCQRSAELSRHQLLWQRRGMRWESGERRELKSGVEVEEEKRRKLGRAGQAEEV